MPKGRSGLPHSKTLREISEHYKQTPAFGCGGKRSATPLFFGERVNVRKKRRRRFALPAQ